MLANGSVGDSGGAPADPFDEDDVGRRFELLKDQMGAEASSGSQTIQANGMVPPPRPIRNPRARDYSDYQTVGGRQVQVKERLTPTKGGRSKQITMAKSIED